MWPKCRSREKYAKPPCCRSQIILNKRLNFDLPFENGRAEEMGFEMGKPQNMPFLSRFLGTVVLASVIGGSLLSFEWIHAAGPPVVQVTPASLEMMRLLRDEHGLMANMVKAQLSTDRRN
jgi:hypothetical protein